MPLSGIVLSVSSASSMIVQIDDKQVNVLLAEIKTPNYNPRSPADSEPFGVEAREFLRDKLAGRQVTVESIKELGENKILAFCYISTALINAEVVKAGFAQPREQLLSKYISQFSEPTDVITSQQVIGTQKEQTPANRIVDAFWTAKFIKPVGMFVNKPISFQFEDLTQKSPKLQQFIDKFRSSKLSGSIDFIRDGESFYIQVINDGIIYKLVGQPFGLQISNEQVSKGVIQQFLQRSAQITPILNQSSNLIMVDVQVKENNLSELILKSKAASVIDWVAKQHKAGENLIKISGPSQKEVQQVGSFKVGKAYKMVVVDIPSSDSFTAEYDGVQQRFYLSSIQAPRCIMFGRNANVEQAGLSCRQFLLKKLYKVNADITIDYVRVLDNEEKGNQQRFYVTVDVDKKNIAFDLIQQGLVKLVKHSFRDNISARDYAEYQELEKVAIEKKLGVHSQNKQVIMNVIDISSMKSTEIKAQASQYKEKRLKGTIEYIMNGGKLKIMLTSKDSINLCFVMTAFANVQVPTQNKQELCAVEAMQYLQDQFLYKEVEVLFSGQTERHTDAMLCQIFDTNNKNVAVQLIENGLARVNPNGPLNKQQIAELEAAMLRAKGQKLGIFGSALETYQFESCGNVKDIVKQQVTGLFVDQYGNLLCRAPQNYPVILKKEDLKRANDLVELKDSEKVINKLCLVEKEDNLVRGRIHKMVDGQISVYLVDYGRDSVCTQFYQLPSKYAENPAAAIKARLAFVDYNVGLKDERDVKELADIFEGKTHDVYLMGYDEYGYLLMLVMAQGTGAKPFDAYNTLSSYFIEKGKGKLIESDQLQASPFYTEMAEFEATAVQAAAGLWRK